MAFPSPRTFLDIDSPSPHVVRICFNNPAKKNAISRTTMRDLADIILAVNRLDDVWVLLLTSKVPGVCFRAALMLARE